MLQLGKQFVPHLLVVPQGAAVSFRNQDAVFHNVFSLSNPNDFDLGLYRGGVARTQTFSRPGPVQLLCNIHAAMNAFLYVADTPWYAVADAAGRFTVKAVPPGAYKIEVWHEAATQSGETRANVAPGMGPLALSVGGDKRAPAFPPDKYGKPRQVQLGY
jgi:hypothetical protein